MSNYDDRSIYDNRLTCCPLCGAPEIRNKYTILSGNDPFDVSECRSCLFIFMNPPFCREYTDALYSRGYYEGDADYTYQDERVNEGYHAFVWDARLKTILKFTKGGALLDVGCSFGGFLKRASACFDPYGIELSSYSGSAAKQIFGDNIHIGTLEDHPFGSSKFSAVTMIEVIEHMADPAAALKECARIISPGGVLVVQTANMNGLQAKFLKDRYAYYMPGHLSYFSASNIRSAMIEAGFRKVKIFYPVDFGLIAKLKKSKMNFKKKSDYTKWIRISLYHAAGRLHFRDRALMSSMVVYAFR